MSTFELEYIKKELIPTFGGQTLLVSYQATHVVHGIKNTYRIVAQLRGIESGQVYLDGQSATCTNSPPLNSLDCNTNEETLIEDAVIDLFDSKVN